MNGVDKTVNELLAILRNAELTMQANPNYMLAVSKTTSFKKKGKSKGKATGKSGAKTKKKPSGSGPNKDTECFYYKAKGHWKRNCKKYLADRKKLGFTIEGIKIYMLLMSFFLVPTLSHGYLIRELLLISVIHYRD